MPVGDQASLPSTQQLLEKTELLYWMGNQEAWALRPPPLASATLLEDFRGVT